MPDTTPSWPTPGSDAPTQPAPPSGDAPTQPAPTPPTEVGPTVPVGPAGPPPPAPTPGGPPGAPGPKRGIPAPAFIVMLVLLVAALAFGIVSFLGKNSESDDKEKAQEQLSQTRSELSVAQDEIASLQEELTGSQQTGEQLGDLVQQAAGVADDLKACTDSAAEFITAFGDAVASGDTTGLDEIAADTDDICASADQSYDELIQIFNEINA